MQLIPKAPENDLRICRTVISVAAACAYFPWTDQYGFFFGGGEWKENLVWKTFHRTVHEYVGIVLFLLICFHVMVEMMESS